MILPLRQTEGTIEYRDCVVLDADGRGVLSFSWSCLPGEGWLITGPNGGGKAALAGLLSGTREAYAQAGGALSNPYLSSTRVVSLEAASRLVEEERRLDDSDYVEGGIDPGRTARDLILAGLPEDERLSWEGGVGLETHPALILAGIGDILDRGLKYLSTGELIRVLLAMALASKAALILLDEPFEGLDAQARQGVAALMEDLLSEGSQGLILLQDRYESVPKGIRQVLEINGGAVSFVGPRPLYEEMLATRAAGLALDQAKAAGAGAGAAAGAASLARELTKARAAREGAGSSWGDQDAYLVEMRDVCVEWSGRRVLEGLSWGLRAGEHWLIRGPNGSGKTSFLELITGDNPQCYKNEIYIFGRRRGTGESIWDIKSRLGIVSYHLHLGYRALSGLSVEEVILSGLHDSIGLYQRCGDAERELAAAWLSMAGIPGRGHQGFAGLSYGEQRLVLVARAAIKCPPILILDEPCHGLDESARARVLVLLEAIGSLGISTLLHVTHDPLEALPCERRVLELRPGQSPMYALLAR